MAGYVIQRLIPPRLTPGSTAEKKWSGQSQILTTPVPARPLDFNLALDDPAVANGADGRNLEDSDTRLMEMLAAQAAHRDDGSTAGDEDTIVADTTLADADKKDLLQKALTMAASNGDVARIRRLVRGTAKDYVDVDKPDEEGTAPLIYASCFVRTIASVDAPHSAD